MAALTFAAPGSGVTARTGRASREACAPAGRISFPVVPNCNDGDPAATPESIDGLATEAVIDVTVIPEGGGHGPAVVPAALVASGACLTMAAIVGLAAAADWAVASGVGAAVELIIGEGDAIMGVAGLIIEEAGATIAVPAGLAAVAACDAPDAVAVPAGCAIIADDAAGVTVRDAELAMGSATMLDCDVPDVPPLSFSGVTPLTSVACCATRPLSNETITVTPSELWVRGSWWFDVDPHTTDAQ